MAAVCLAAAVRNTPDQPATGSTGMVSSAHPLATRAGLEILGNGGNAFDAAVAVAATLNVVEPMMSGMGGYGVMLIFDARKREVRFVDSSGRMPAKLAPDVFRPPVPNHLVNLRGAKVVSTPGNANGWEAVSRSYGKLPWRRLFESAIRVAEEGFEVTATTARHLKSAFPEFPEHAKTIYGGSGQPLQAGDRLVQKDLAASLRRVAELGAKVIHGGELGLAIAAAMKETGGFVTLEDLRDNRAEWGGAIQIDYRGRQVFAPGPPTNSWNGLLRLGLMSRFDLNAAGRNTAAYLHRYAEVTKLAYSSRLRYASDPDIAPPPLARLLSADYWRTEAAKVAADRAAPFTAPAEVGREQTHDSLRGGRPHGQRSVGNPNHR